MLQRQGQVCDRQKGSRGSLHQGYFSPWTPQQALPHFTTSTSHQRVSLGFLLASNEHWKEQKQKLFGCSSFSTWHGNGEWLFFLNKFIYFIYLFLAVLGLCCCVWTFSSCGERGLLFFAVHGLLIAVTSLCCRARALGARASVVVACGLQSAGSVVVEHGLSCSAARGIFPDQGSNPCPLHWQADS